MSSYAFPETENPLDLLCRDMAACLRCPKRRRWLICSPWLAMPYLIRRAWREAKFNARTYSMSAMDRMILQASQWSSVGPEIIDLIKRIAALSDWVMSVKPEHLREPWRHVVVSTPPERRDGHE